METVRYDVAGGVATITIDRPERRNAIDKPTAEALAEALSSADASADVGVIVLTGAGGSFCAGMDLKALKETGKRPVVPGRGAFGMVEQPPEKPLIGAVEGHALGGGFEVALCCDLLVAARSSTFGLPEVKRGLIAAAGGLLRLPDRIPRAVAKELALTGEPITAERALAIGLVNRVVEPGEALTVATELAASIAANAPLAVRASKEVIDASAGWPADDRFASQAPIVQRIRDSEDAQEGSRAFAERRAPVWTGR